jgi:hypothetical protein
VEPDALRRAWERFLEDGDEAAFLEVVRAWPRRRPSADVEYPEIHRICDVELCGQAYRVMRTVDVVDGEERLFVEPTEAPNYDTPGVPYWLQGEGLRRWVVEEGECPAKGEIDWEQYRGG